MHDATIGSKHAVKQRDHGVDFLRCIACCAVVGLHTFNNGLSFVIAAFYYAFGFAVPVFFMASGAFLLNRGGCSWSYSARKIWRLVAVLLLWAFAVTFATAVKDLLVGAVDASALAALFLSTVKGALFQYGSLSHCWFLWALILLYALLPLLSRLSARGKCTLFGIAAAVAVGVQIASCIVGWPLESRVP